MFLQPCGLNFVQPNAGPAIPSLIGALPIVPVAQPSVIPSGPTCLVGRVKSPSINENARCALADTAIAHNQSILLPTNRPLVPSVQRNRTQSVNMWVFIS